LPYQASRPETEKENGYVVKTARHFQFDKTDLMGQIPLHPAQSQHTSNSAFVRNCHSSYRIPTLSSMHANFSSMPCQASRPEIEKENGYVVKTTRHFRFDKTDLMGQIPLHSAQA
jgi:hypothetical protein